MPTVVAVDPGREKCGLAVVSGPEVRLRAVVPTAEVGLTCRYLLAQHPGATLLLGDATCSAQVRQALRQASPGVEPVSVPESHSTLAARRLYFADYPPRWWQRLLPAGMLVPPRPVDDYAAVVLAQRYLQQPRPN